MPVEVEVVVSYGMPGFNIVGMADAAVQESRERVKAALRQSGYVMPTEKILVNLAPSSLKKSGSGFDLPIALGILGATQQLRPEALENRLFVGELSLTGRVRPVAGLLAYALCAREQGLSLVCAADPIGLIPVEGLREEGLESLGRLRAAGIEPIDMRLGEREPIAPDFSEISGNEVAKRAMQIAAAGGHGILMMGPPGSGKTMLASRLPSILPDFEGDECLETALIHSVAGKETDSILAGQRPFRAPHHSATPPSLVGGGSPTRPGEVSLAHGGVLFLDELAEFRPSVLQQIRQPLEDGKVRISRAEGTFEFPASFMLVGASNPCPCGYFGDEERTCTCSPTRVYDYQARIGGPLMDRIDIHIDVRRVDPGDVMDFEIGSSSFDLKQGVLAGREFASWRLANDGAADTARKIIASCRLSEDDRAFFEEAARSNSMSGRGIVRTLSVARTIADMDERAVVGRADLNEALGFRIRAGVDAL